MRTLFLSTALLSLSLLAIGQDSISADTYLYEGSSSKVYYKEVPNRMFIQKSPDVSQDYILSLLNRLTDSLFEYSLCPIKEYISLTEVAYDTTFRIIVNDTLIDNVIDKLLEDDGVLTARRIFVEKEYYDKYVESLQQSGADSKDYFKDPHMKPNERWFFNEISCSLYKTHPDSVPMDSICRVLGLNYILNGNRYTINTPKKTDLFTISQKLYETGFFMSVRIKYILPFANAEFGADLDGYWKIGSDHFFVYNKDNSKRTYYELPNRIYIQKSANVTQDYINALLNSIIDSDFEKDWPFDEICRVVTYNAFSDSIINEILKDDGILSARHIYVEKSKYYHYRYYPDLERGEEWLFNEIKCLFEGEPNEINMDSISTALGLTIQEIDKPYVLFKTSKTADIFDISQRLFESGCFAEVNPQIGVPPIVGTWTDVHPVSASIQETVYYNLSGHKIDSPSGLTIVVTRFSDGRTYSEKILFE